MAILLQLCRELLYVYIIFCSVLGFIMIFRLKMPSTRRSIMASSLVKLDDEAIDSSCGPYAIRALEKRLSECCGRHNRKKGGLRSCLVAIFGVPMLFQKCFGENEIACSSSSAEPLASIVNKQSVLQGHLIYRESLGARSLFQGMVTCLDKNRGLGVGKQKLAEYQWHCRTFHLSGTQPRY